MEPSERLWITRVRKRHARPVDDAGLYQRIAADVNDLEFLNRFQRGLKISQTFREFHIAPGNYGAAGDQDDVAQRLITVDLENALKIYETPMSLFEDTAIETLNYSNALECCKHLIFQAVICSARLNFALGVGTGEGFIPLADATPFGDLLGAKYARAVNKLRVSNNQIQLTDLSFGVLDELVPAERLWSIRGSRAKVSLTPWSVRNPGSLFRTLAFCWRRYLPLDASGIILCHESFRRFREARDSVQSVS